MENTGKQIIDWSLYNDHGLSRLSERNVTPQMVELWVKTGKALQQAGDKIIYITREGAAVVSSIGKLITAYPSSYFDDNMKEVVIKLFGR